MKIELKDNIIIIYLYYKEINLDDISKLNNQIKELFLTIMKRYNIDFFGYNIVNIYHNDNYGLILEINKIYDGDIRYKTIDLKIVVYKNTLMYLEFDDYYFEKKPNNLIYNKGKYYLEITNSLNINKYIEFAKIKYKKLLNEID